MSKSRKGDNPKNRNNTGISGGAGVILLALLIILSGAAYFAFQELTSGPAIKPNSATGSKNDADYNERCDALHAAVDGALTRQNVIVSDVHQETKEAARQNTDGKIRWNARNLLIEASESVSAEAIRRSVEAALKPAGGLVLKMEPDQYHGYSVTRIDIGFQDRLGGGPLTIISDRLYIVATAKKPVAPGVRPKTNSAHKGEIALIIDDFGYRQDMITGFAAIRQPFTFAVIPFKPYSRDAAAKGLASGHQVILHLPMEPMSGVDAAETAITVRVGMNAEQIRELLEKATASLPGVTGVNNHQGSKATADRNTMEAIMKVLRQKGLFFVDSRTNGRSVAMDTARRQNVKTTENDLFIDGMADVAYVKKQLRAAGEMAIKAGSVTVIGHARPTTLAALREMIPELEARGIRFVFVSQLVR